MSLDSLKQEASSHNTSVQRLRELAAINDELARLVAANSLANSSLLEELALKARTKKDTEMQRALVSNPNTPPQWLIGLGYLFPEELFGNPAYSLLILEDVNFAYRFSKKLLLKLVSTSNAPTSFLECAASIAEFNLTPLRNEIRARLGRYSFEDFWKWREVLIIIASHQNTSREKLLELSIYGDDIVSKVAQLRLACPKDDIKFWDEVASYKQLNLILFIPRNLMFKLVQLPDISTEFLKAASQLETSSGILNIIANHIKTPKEVLDKLAESSIPFVAASAKLHINYTRASKIEWREQAESKIDRTQLPNVTDNEEGIELRLWHVGVIHKKTLFYLNQTSIYTYTNTLLKILCSADTSQSILDDLEKHSRVSQLITECITYLNQREAIFFNLLPQALPIDNDRLLSRFAVNQINPLVAELDTLLAKIEDRAWRIKVRFVSIKEPAIHVCLVDLIQKSMGSRKRRSYLREMLKDFDKGRYKEYDLIYIKLSNLEYYGVILASYPNTSPQILSELAEHPIEGVRVLVANHYNITQNSLNNLINDRSPEVRAAALANPKFDSTLKEQLASLENPDLSCIDLLELANSNHSTVRAKVAQHLNVDESIIAKLADDKLIVKLAIARNPKTPADILTRFTKHPERRLHLAVAQNSGAPIDLLIKLATQPAVRGGFHFNPLNLAAVKSLLTQEPEVAISLLDRCLKFPERPSFSRFLVLMSPYTPNSFLARYYKSWFWAERYAIAQNPNTDRDICQQLTQDPNSIVRAAAQDTLK